MRHPHRLMAVAVVCCLPLGFAAHAQTIANESVRVELDAAAGYAITGLAQPEPDIEFLASPPADSSVDRSPWKLTLRAAQGRQTELTAADSKSATHRRDGDALTVTWTGVGGGDVAAELTVVVRLRAPRGAGKSYWDIDVHGRAAGVLWQVDFPRMFGIRGFGEDRLSVPYYWGRLIRDPARHRLRYTLTYPQPASMQFFAYWGTTDLREPGLPSVEKGVVETGWSPDRSDAAGLYWATEDGDGFMKRFAIDSQTTPGLLAWHVEHVPGLDMWPLPRTTRLREIDYSPSYDTAVTTFTGDYHEAAAMYLDWAKGQPWCQRGPADEWPEQRPKANREALARWTPPWFRELGFWAKFYHEPAKALPEWAAYRKWLRVPMASHYYRYNVARFDDNYPEHLPPDPYLLQGVRDARAIGVRPLPYINGVIWDTDTQSWIRENGLAAAIKNENGAFYPWDIHGELFAHMCPVEQWRAKMRETTEKLVWEHGMGGVYLDCLAATRARPCYDPTHGHTIRGGDYRAKGNRQLMFDLREHTRRLDPEACFFTEEIGEQYLDVMDGNLTLDLMRSYCRPGEQVFPVFTAAYHPYTINFGCDARIDMDESVFAWQVGETFIWGAQPLLSASVARSPEAGDANSEFLREVVQAYYQVGQRFLQGGTWRRIAVRPFGTRDSKSGIELATRPHVVEYSKLRDRVTTWAGPAVMASAWERGGDTAVVMVNVTTEEQPVELTVRSDRLTARTPAWLVRAWPQPADSLGESDGAHELSVPACRAMICVLTNDVQRATRTLPLTDDPWKLLTVEDGRFPGIDGPAGSLWTCSEGLVQNQVRRAGTRAEALQFDDSGELAARSGKQASARGPKAEGRGLPRAAADQPFLLMRRLPHTLKAQDATARVLSGDDEHLLCRISGPATLTFGQPGYVIVSDADTGETTRSLAEGATTSIAVPEGGVSLVGYARLDCEELGEALSQAIVLKQRCAPLLAALRAVVKAPPVERARALAGATRALRELESSLGEAPGALTATSPLRRVHHQLQALAAAYTASCLRVQIEDDWLTPGKPKEVQVVAMRSAGFAGRLESVRLVPVGAWPDGAAQVVNVPQKGDLGERTGVFGFRLTVNAAEYVERLVPVLACARVRKDGLEFDLTEVVRLEANRPFELRGPTTPVTVVAGQPGTTTVTLRNWSPHEVEVSLAVDTLEGWQVDLAPPLAAITAGQDATVQVKLTPPADCARGEHRVACAADYSDLPGTEVITVLRLSVLESLVPWLSATDSWQPPAADNLARFRQRGKLALYKKEGERIRLTISNLRVTQYTDSLKLKLLGPDLEPLVDESLPVDGERELDVVAKQTGTHYLELRPGQGSAQVTSGACYVAEIATKEDPLYLFCSPIERHFLVPADSRGFRLGAVDGGPDETAQFVVTSPTGRVAYEANGNYSGAEVEIEVRPEERGKLWTIKCTPRQDMHFWLSGQVCPYLSTSPERVLVPARHNAVGN